MISVLRCIIFLASLMLLGQISHACELSFRVDGDYQSYSFEQLPDFVREKIRNSVVKTEDENDRYKILINYGCKAGEAESSFSESLTIQKNTVYIKDLNGVPLCVESQTPSGLRCERTKYNYVDYKGGANLQINKNTVTAAAKAVSYVDDVGDLQAAFLDPSKEKTIHDAIRIFAFIFAESARFDYVLDDLSCSISKDGAVSFMDYWTLLHNWGSISARVNKYKPSLKPSDAHDGAGALFVPVTREMIPFFNQSLIENPPKSDDVTKDGKNKPVPVRADECSMQPLGASVQLDPQQERDEIFSLAAMVMVEKEWQTSTNGRGHNIGSLLVDKDNRPVFWARNAVSVLDNGTKHGEVRLIENFLNCKNVGKYAEGYTVYTTLEPCAMCAGMLAMTKVSRVVYLQSDPDYGHVRDALASIQYKRIYTESTPSQLGQKKSLDEGYQKFINDKNNKSITDYLLSDDASRIFSNAVNDLGVYQVRYEENKAVLANVISYIDEIPNKDLESDISSRCPK